MLARPPWKNILGGKKTERKKRKTDSFPGKRAPESRQTSDSFRTSAATPPVWQENQADSGMVGGGSDQDERFTVSRGRKEGRKEVLTLEGNFFFLLSLSRKGNRLYVFLPGRCERRGG